MKKDNIHKIIMLAVLAVITLALPIATIIKSMNMPEKAFSETENRYLQDFPEFTFENITNKSYMEDFQEYFSDRFVLREQWIGIKNDVDRILGQKEIKGIFTEDGRMIEAWKSYDSANVERNLAAMQAFAEKYNKANMYFMLAPNAQEIYSDTLPANCGALGQKAFIKMCYDSTPGIAGIDAYTSLYTAKDEYIYYRTDHHWTSLGAYLGYSAAAPVMKYNPYSIDKFSIEHAASDFRGTLYSKTLDNGIAPDIIDFYSLNNPEIKSTITVKSDGKETVHEGLYYREYLTKKDKYSSYLGLNVPCLEINTTLPEGTDNGSLLVIKDSYAHSLIPFLCNNYSKITVLDLRYINTNLENFVNISEYDNVLFMYNVITFSEDTNLKKLKFLA